VHKHATEYLLIQLTSHKIQLIAECGYEASYVYGDK